MTRPSQTTADSANPPRRISLSQPFFTEAEWQAVRDTLESGWVMQGPRVRAFEAAFAKRHQVAHAVAVSSGTAALHLVLMAHGIGRGDEVIVPAYTWVATANVVIHAGAVPVFVDVCQDTGNLDSSQVEGALTDKTRAIIPVHLFGLCADTSRLAKVLPAGVALFEDAACAAGATRLGKPAGSFGQAACFSFHPRKSITTGEGGMVVTSDPDLARMVRALRNHGLSEPEGPSGLSELVVPGFNYRMTDIQAAIGLVQLGRLDAFVETRNHWAHWYLEELSDLGWLQLPAHPPGYGHAWQAFVVVLREDAPVSRPELMQRLHEKGIATRSGTQAVPELSWYQQRFRFRTGQFPVAGRLAARSLALPLHNRMSPDDYRYVVDALHEVG